MDTIGLPVISIEFKSKAKTFIKRGSSNTVALILKDEPIDDKFILNIKDEKDIPTELTEENIAQIKLALKGADNKPGLIRVILVNEEKGSDTLTKSKKSNAPDSLDKALAVLKNIDFDYLAYPEASKTEVKTISDWIIEMRDENKIKVKAVLPNSPSDHEGIINFTTDNIVIKEEEAIEEDKVYTTAEYCSRIAGLLAGTPLTRSATYLVLDEIKSIDIVEDSDARTRKGELVLIDDGDKIKVARAVNSLVTLGEYQNTQWKKILIVEKMDLWYKDIHNTISNQFIGASNNRYDDKTLLITDIRQYNKLLEKENILDDSKISYNHVEIDIEATKNYLDEVGVDTSQMDEDEIKKENTGDKVFIKANLKFIDAMEEIYIVANV